MRRTIYVHLLCSRFIHVKFVLFYNGQICNFFLEWGSESGWKQFSVIELDTSLKLREWDYKRLCSVLTVVESRIYSQTVPKHGLFSRLNFIAETQNHFWDSPRGWDILLKKCQRFFRFSSIDIMSIFRMNSGPISDRSSTDISYHRKKNHNIPNQVLHWTDWA